MTGPRPLHRLFGLSWSDFFQGSDVSVELEVDLSRRQQLLDVVLIRRGSNPIPWPLPDGFEELAPHNLVTFKSHQEALDGWTLAELIGHAVNYRKQMGPSPQEVLPESDVRLYAVCVRFPQNLDASGLLQPIRDGVYEVVIPTIATIRVIVVHRLPQAEHNAMLHLFSAREEMLRYARDHYRPRSSDTSTLLLELFQVYDEDPAMPADLHEYVRENLDRILKKFPPEELRKHLSPEERVKGLTLTERLEGLSPAERRELLEELHRQLGDGTSPENN